MLQLFKGVDVYADVHSLCQSLVATAAVIPLD